MNADKSATLKKPNQYFHMENNKFEKIGKFLRDVRWRRRPAFFIYPLSMYIYFTFKWTINLFFIDQWKLFGILNIPIWFPYFTAYNTSIWIEMMENAIPHIDLNSHIFQLYRRNLFRVIEWSVTLHLGNFGAIPKQTELFFLVPFGSAL